MNIEVGMGGSVHLHSDIYPVTVIEVWSAAEVKVQKDTWKKAPEGSTEEYEISRDPNGEIEVFTLRTNGQWIRTGDPTKRGIRLTLGQRERYYDRSF